MSYEKRKKYYQERYKRLKEAGLIKKVPTEIRYLRERKYKLKRRLDPNYFLRENASDSIRKALKRMGKIKQGKSVLSYFGYSIEDLKNHLESLFEPWMNWDNHGSYKRGEWNDNDPSTWKWQLDHIIPQADLPYESMEDENFKKCWCLNNLRPLSAKVNISDGASRVRHKKVNNNIIIK
jgi:hypothetical protein